MTQSNIRFAVITLLLGFGAFKLVSALATPPTPEQLAARQQEEAHQARISELWDKQLKSLRDDDAPRLTLSECHELHPHKACDVKHLSLCEPDDCVEQNFSDPEPRPVYVVPNPN